MVGKSKVSQIVAKKSTVTKKVEKTVEPNSIKDGFSNSENEIKITKKEKGEKALNKSKEYVLGEKGATIKITKLPKGFNETELFKFFKQFGDIKGVKVDRNLSGKVSTRAFIRFFSAEVAKIAKETMNGYIMFGKKLCVEIPDGWVPHQKEFCPLSIISDASKIHMEAVHQMPERKKEECDLYNEKSLTTVVSMLNDRIEKENQLKEKLKEFNIDYKFTGYLDTVKSTLSPKTTTPTPTTTKTTPEPTKTTTPEPTKTTTPEPTKTTTTTKKVTKTTTPTPAPVPTPTKTVSKKTVKSK